MSRSASLNAAQRAADLDALASGEVVDVLVIGGGVTGAGAALDAASRGLSVALVERHDLAFGTSRWSSKLVHGGLRYLAQGAVGIAMESARERGIMLARTAPHLVRPIPIVTPLLPEIDRKTEQTMRAGLKLGDSLRRAAGTSVEVLPRSRRVGYAEAIKLAGSVRRDGLRGALVAWDAQLEDDARLVVALARTAASFGARIVTRAEVLEAGRGGVRVRDSLTGVTHEISARSVVNATGVWAGTLAEGLTLRPSRGSHLVLDNRRLGNLPGTINVPVPGERNRWVFAIGHPGGRAYVGLTDAPVEGPLPDVPDAPEEDIDFLLNTLSSALDVPLGRDDVLGTYAGLRPLVDTGSDVGGQTADISRKHVVLTGDDGVVTVTGGKLTTYRQMAEEAIDAAVASGGLEAGRVRDPRPAADRRRRARRARARRGAAPAGRPLRHRGAARSRRGAASCSSPSFPAPTCSARSSSSRCGTRVRWTPATCSTGARASAWCRAIASAPSRSSSRCSPAPRAHAPWRSRALRLT